MKLFTKLLTVSLFGILGCSDGQLKADLEKTKAELEKTMQELTTCASELADVLNTPDQRLLNAKKLSVDGNFSSARDEYEQIVTKFPNTQYSNTAVKELAVLQKAIQKREVEAEKQRAEEERKKALGFKVLKPSNTVKFGDLSLNFEKVWIGKRWSFDDRGSEYSLRDATRGNQHVLVRVSISSESKNPDLPPILAYQYFDGKLILLGALRYEFRRWKDYGSYLGNYADYGNDFAHSKKIPFNLGFETSQDNLKSGRVYVVMRKIQCFTRENKDFDRPEVEYKMGICAPKSSLVVSDFENDYVLIKTL
ncbi:hypothetical protein V5097_07835 [Arenibacter palladensis]|uniref:hypothetical protein n=1 Tax=Arenibacter palladensis TaxID=237373 RepID=UPI002FD58560